MRSSVKRRVRHVEVSRLYELFGQRAGATRMFLDAPAAVNYNAPWIEPRLGKQAWRPMAPHRRNCFWSHFPRRLCAGTALLCYLIAAVGFPLPGLPAKDSTQPSPCQGYPCCCQTAGQGMGHCCCCSGHPDRAAHSSTEAEQPSANSQPKPSARVPWMPGFTALRCQGAAHLWVSLGAALPPPIPLEWSEPLIATDWLSPQSSSPYPLPFVPPDPPPRFRCA
jgi:hypothetical protein